MTKIISSNLPIKVHVTLTCKLRMLTNTFFTAIETKFLRLVINNNLSWKRHIEGIKSKLSSVSNAMR